MSNFTATSRHFSLFATEEDGAFGLNELTQQRHALAAAAEQYTAAIQLIETKLAAAQQALVELETFITQRKIRLTLEEKRSFKALAVIQSLNKDLEIAQANKQVFESAITKAKNKLHELYHHLQQTEQDLTQIDSYLQRYNHLQAVPYDTQRLYGWS